VPSTSPGCEVLGQPRPTSTLLGGDAALYRGLGVADVPWRWSVDELASDVLHKGVYAVVTGAVYDALAGSAD